MSWVSWLTSFFWQSSGPPDNSALFYYSVDSENPQCFYRIPSIYVFHNYCYAFCEQRLDTVQDRGRMNVAMRRIKLSLLDAQSDTTQWEPFERLPDLEGYRTMNPCPVGCADSKTLFVLVAAIKPEIEESEILKGVSTDDFRIFVTSKTVSEDVYGTWEPWTDITYSVKGNLPVGSRFCVIGPGHGIQLSSGRLVVPGYFYRSFDSFAKIKPNFQLANYVIQPPYSNVGCSFCLISDDFGSTWRVSDSSQNYAYMAQGNTFRNMGECSVVESKTGCLTLNSREYGSGSSRIIARSSDGGESWNPAHLQPQLNDPTSRGCKGGFVKVTHNEKDYLVACNCGHHSSRKDLSIWVSSDDGSSWSKPWQVKGSGFAGYSDMDVFQDTVSNKLFIVILYETGHRACYERIDFVCVDFERCLRKCFNDKKGGKKDETL